MKIKLDPADKAFSIWIRLRDMECKRCGSAVKLNDKGLPVTHQASHFFGRRKESTRFEPLNVDTLCTGCHSYLGGNPNEHRDWQIKQKGEKMIDKLTLLANSYKKKDRKLEEMFWKQQIKEDYEIKI
jgi:hypothetical protein